MPDNTGMANRTVDEQVTELEAERAVLKTAITAAQTAGLSSFATDGLSATYRLAELRADLIRVEKSLQRLYRGGRGFVIDMSHPGGSDSGSTDSTVYTKVQA